MLRSLVGSEMCIRDSLATIVQHADDMAAAYEEAFGAPLVLSPGVENASYEWIKRVLQNGAVIVRSTDDVSNAVGAPGQVDPPVGLTAFSRLRDKEKNPQLAFDVAYGVKPVLGVEHQVVVAVVNRAPHPNAAKLLIQWMMGDDYGGWGYAPYHVFGNLSLIHISEPTRLLSSSYAVFCLTKKRNWTIFRMQPPV